MQANDNQIVLTQEEKLLLDNLKLKVQLAELQKTVAIQALNSFTRDLLNKYDVQVTDGVTLTDSQILVEKKPAIEP